MNMKEGVVDRESKKPEFEFKDLATAQEYLEWKKAVPTEVRRLVEAIMKGKEPPLGQTGLALSDQFLTAFGKMLTPEKQTDLSGVDRRVFNLLAPLERIETKGGYLNVFETLRNPDASWSLKRKIFETQIKPALDWLVEKDLEKLAEETKQEMERKETEKEEQKEESSEKKEGEPNAFFSVNPFYGGYFKKSAYRRLNQRTFEWEKGENELIEPESEKLRALETKILSGKIRGNQILALPLPYDWAVDMESIETDAPKEDIKIFKNQNGDWHLQIVGEGIFQYRLRIAPRQSVEIGGKFNELEMSGGGELGKELEEKIEALKKENLPKMKLAREIVKFIRNNLVYSSGSAESVAAWRHYIKNPNEFFKGFGKKRKRIVLSPILWQCALWLMPD